MPQAANNYGFQDDCEAFDVLAGGRFYIKKGRFHASEGTVPTSRERAALSYLINEWDYAYEGPWPD